MKIIREIRRDDQGFGKNGKLEISGTMDELDRLKDLLDRALSGKGGTEEEEIEGLYVVATREPSEGETRCTECGRVFDPMDEHICPEAVAARHLTPEALTEAGRYARELAEGDILQHLTDHGSSGNADPEVVEPPDGLSDEGYRSIAREEYHEDGKIEIDDDGLVSRSEDGGAYVQAWVWVYGPSEES